MSSIDAKTYLSKRNVPALFECLMTGLMFHRPTDHIQYLIDCLEKVKVKGQEEMRWNMFIEMQRSKTPLPPITPTNGRRPISRERSMTPKIGPGYFWVENYTIQEEAVPEQRTPTPLPPIGFIPDVPIVFVTGGPGSGSADQAQLLQRKHPGWVVVAMGQLLRQEVSERGNASAKWKMVSDLMSEGDMAPEDVVDTILLTQLKGSPSAEGFIIQGFPRDMEQAEQFDKLVGRLDAVFLVDCEQESLSQRLLARAKQTGRIDNNVNTVAKRIQTFRDKTLPVLKHYEDMEKLYVIEGEKKEQEIAEDLALMFETVVCGKGTLLPSPPKEPKPERVKTPPSGKTTPKKAKSPEPSPPTPEPQPQPPAPEQDDAAPLASHLLPPEVTVKDEGRKADMPTAPIIFVAGGPGSGKGTQCKRLLSRYPSAVHLSMGDIIRSKISTEGTADQKWGMVTDLLRKGDLAPEEVTVELLTNALKSHPQAHFYLVEGFPRNLEQLEDFNKQIGGQSFTILLDCEEHILHYRLSRRGKNSERIDDNLTAIGKKLTFFKNTTLPILKTIDDSGKLVQVNGDRDEDEIQFDLCTVLDFAIYGTVPAMPGASETKEPVAEEVIEAAIVAASGTTTGDNIANPSYSAELDATAETKKPDEEETKTSEPTEAKDSSEPAKDGSTPAVETAPAVETTLAEKPPETADKAAEESGKTEEASQPDDAPKQEAPTATDNDDAAAKSAEDNDASKPAEAATAAAAAASSEDKEEAPKKTEDAAKTEEPRTAEAAAGKSEEALKEDEAAKPDQSPKTEESPQAEEAPKAEETAASAEADAAEEKPAAESVPASEEKKKAEEGEATASDAPKESTEATDQTA